MTNLTNFHERIASLLLEGEIHPVKEISLIDAAEKLYHARLYLANLPFESQTFEVINGKLVNTAIPILFNAECVVRLIDAKYLENK